MRRFLRVFGAIVAGGIGTLVLVASIVVAAYRPAFGQSAEGDRLERVQRSPQWRDSVFENPQPLWNDTSMTSMLQGMWNASAHAFPRDPKTNIPVVHGDAQRFETAPSTGLRVTWFGHSSLLIEIDGKRVLTDPVWGPTSSPIPWLGPARWYAPPVALRDLPSVDAVVISHDHYDHLDYPTFKVIREWESLFFVPLGVGAHLESWGVPPERIIELDWWDRRTIGSLELVCTPARHASGRHLFDQNTTLWAGWALITDKHRVFFSGDTGLFDDMKTIGERLGPFDVTMLEIGAYDRRWPDWHLGPEQAVLAHKWLRGNVLLPVHWGLFDLAFHGWTEPIERVMAAAESTRIATPPPGQSFEPTDVTNFPRWWPRVPWQSADEHPIIATNANGRPIK